MGSTAHVSLLVPCLLLAAGEEGVCAVLCCAVLQLAVLCAQEQLACTALETGYGDGQEGCLYERIEGMAEC